MSKTTFPHAVHDFYKPHDSYAISDWSPSLTRQEFAEDADINVIMSRYETTGVLPVNGREPAYLDLTKMPPDLMTTMNMLQDATAAFMTLPATVRREFENDPEQFVAFASDPENLDQMRTWGLAPPQEAQETPRAAPEPAPAAAPEAAPKPA